MYAWEALSHNDFESLFEIKKPEKVATRFLSDHWLTEGELWTLCGLDRYGNPKMEIPEKRPFEIC